MPLSRAVVFAFALALSSFAYDVRPLRPLAERDHANIVSWQMHDRGSHWATQDAPDAVCVPGRAGDVIAFSSLAPHRTGPNLQTGSVRKAYILQYAPDGAFTVRSGVKAEQNDPARQYKILGGGA